MINKLHKSVKAIQDLAPGFVPDAALVLGSGLGFLADAVDFAVTIPYANIPGFPVSTAPGHAGRLVLGILAGKKCRGGSTTMRAIRPSRWPTRCG
jgi:purine nucleoside phosphorylase